ncbi:hypothetical protein H920_07877 [Fukomys damarensis]|uniref:Uncharacterized protein n=1 Tax=Fukomys damarensis TaxID=885580 RepID=A0A091DF70_FUKDA|nr:hypothetical protein H920_07877 [Fukomys damarensis]
MQIFSKDLHWEAPKATGASWKAYASRVRNLCHQAEESTPEPKSGSKRKDQSSPEENSSTPRDSEDLSSSDDNSQVCIRKTCHANFSKKINSKGSSPLGLFLSLATTLNSGFHGQTMLIQFSWVLQVHH